MAHDAGAAESSSTALDDPSTQTEHVLAEARMVLPGLLSLLGLQMMAVFNAVFHEKLAAWEQTLHAVALCLIVVGVALVLTPAAYHRVVAPFGLPPHFPRLASGFLIGSMVPLMLVLTIDVYLGTRLGFESPIPSAVMAGVTFVLLAAMWFVFPVAAKRRKQQR